MDDNVRYITDHPNFQDNGDYEPDFDLLKEDALDEVDDVIPARAVCIKCIYKHDSRPFWKRWLRKPRAADLLCQARPLQAMQHPVIGGVTYTNSVFSFPSKGLPRPFDRCQDVNLNGHCYMFETKDGRRLEDDGGPSF
jgi:hypothetical protein